MACRPRGRFELPWRYSAHQTMSQVGDSDTRLDSLAEGESGEYRAISALAVTGLLLGIASALALIGVLLWAVPLLAVVVNVIALVRIDRSGGMLAGRPAALAGLALGLVFGTAAPAQFLSTEYLLARRAERVGLEWFQALAHDQPQVAMQLATGVLTRSRLNDPQQIMDYYRSSPDRRRELERYASEPLVRTLLALDGRATVRLYETLGVTSDDQRNLVTQVYAVTFEDQGQRKTFFVSLNLERNVPRGGGRVEWRVTSYAGGVQP